MSTFLKSQKAFRLALDTIRQISADLNEAKDVNSNNNYPAGFWSKPEEKLMVPPYREVMKYL